MHRSLLVRTLLGPSLLSASITIILSCVVLGGAGWSSLTPHSGVYEYLFGSYGLVTVLQNATNALSAINGAFGSPVAYGIAVAVFAVLVGLLVYVFLESVDHVVGKASGALQEVEFINDEKLKKQAEHQAEFRFGLRLTTLIVWTCYLVFFARVVVPACLLVARPEAHPHILTWRNSAVFILGFVALAVAVHAHVIFMRLLVLRPRLFGGDIVGRGGH